LAGALPHGTAKREIGRRVLSTLYEGAAPTFVALATRMANGSARGLTGPGIRARVSLSISAAPHLGVVSSDPLAYALVTRRELSADWLSGATGSLLERRLTGRLLERAAREAATRARQGDTSALEPFAAVFDEHADEPLVEAWRSLLADRETLVWRHVAAARGLLSSALRRAEEEIEAHLSPELSPTEWRRAATSLVASFAVAPDASLARALGVLGEPIVQRDPGVVIAMMWGVPRAADAEPEACDELLARIAKTHALYTAEALVDLRGECGAIGDDAARATAAAVKHALEASSDEEVDALARGIYGELEGTPQSELATSIELAVSAFLEQGTREARTRAQRALGDAATIVAALEMIPIDKHGTPIAGRRGVAATDLRAFDRHVLEAGELKSLLLLDRAAGAASAGVGALDDLDERVTRWLLKCESSAQPAGEPPAHVALHQRQLRALLHIIDGETTDFEEGDRRARVQARWARASRLLLARLNEEGSSPFRRSVTATLARALDALVRDGGADAVDVLLYAASRMGAASDLGVLAEASMDNGVSPLVDAYARFDQAVVDGREEQALAALEALTTDIPAGLSQRVDALRGGLLRLLRALTGVAQLQDLGPLADVDASPLITLEDALSRLTQLVQSAHRRVGDDAPAAEGGGSGAYPLAMAVCRAITPGAGAEATLEPYITATIAAAGRALPRSLARVVAIVLPRVAHLPPAPLPTVAAPSIPPTRSAPPPASRRGVRLPAWMPARRTLGGFYVVGPLGQGGSGTVFVVTRAEERHDADAERFALKVPEFDANAARSLSEADFLRIFRSEASALLSIPEHENLAKFVTFDAGAKPKPILVMELVEGASLDAVLEARALTTARAFTILDGLLAALGAMHGVEVGHLDLKPSNVILRGGEERPVLVDFGLAGRHIRPGCGTGNYVAPEVWVEGQPGASPLTADVYAFGCVAYELLTGETLFDAANEVALVSAHLTHDGMPAPVKRLAQDPKKAALGMLLHGCLRHAPAARMNVGALRPELARAARELAQASWPL
ncbi:MAG TPA: protein kinase, partial [Byssovorax sp.]